MCIPLYANLARDWFYAWLLICITSCAGSTKDEKYSPHFISVDTSAKKTLILGLPSLMYNENCDLLVKYVNERVHHAELKLIPCGTYDDYLLKLKSRYFDVSIINGIEALKAIKNGYAICGKMSDTGNTRGVIFARKDSVVKSITDLKHRTIALAGNTDVPATMTSLHLLYSKGIDRKKNLQTVFLLSFESAIMSVYLGKSFAGISLKRSYQNFMDIYPEINKELQIIGETPCFTNNAVLFKTDMNISLRDELVGILLHMREDESGRNALEKLRVPVFEPANESAYTSLEKMREEFLKLEQRE